MRTASVERWFYLAFLSMVWGSSYILIKTGLLAFGYLQAASLRLMAAGLICLPFGIYFVQKIPKGKIPMVVLSGLLSMALPSYLFCIAQEKVPSSIAGILVALTPVWTLLFATLFFRSTCSKNQLLGLLLGLAGSVALNHGTTASESISGYVFFIVLATMCYGLNANLVKRFLHDVHPLYLTTVGVTFNGVLAFVLAFLPDSGPYRFDEELLPSLIALVALGIFSTALAQFIHNRMIQVSSPLFASSVTYLIPVVAIGWGTMDGEPLTIFHVVATAGIMMSVYLIRQEKPSTVPRVGTGQPSPLR
jgi:drug/metabolite transporter (DMT)-like permease